MNEKDYIITINTEIIESIKITIVTDTSKETKIFSLGDLVNIEYLDDYESKTITGKISKFNREILNIDASKEYDSLVETINIDSIRKIELVEIS